MHPLCAYARVRVPSDDEASHNHSTQACSEAVTLTKVRTPLSTGAMLESKRDPDLRQDDATQNECGASVTPAPPTTATA